MIPALEIKNLSKTYSNGIKALNGIDLCVQNGDFFALLGANGAGKSTTIGVVSTLLNKTSGEVTIQGHDLDLQPEKAKSCLGLVPQEINLNIFETCEQILLSQAGYYGIPRAQAKPHMEELLQQLGIWEKRHSMARHLSGGMKRRLMIARALVHQPKLLILDEPTAGLDIEIRRIIWDFLIKINAQGTTIILTTHYLEEAEQLCKNIAIIDKGQIIKNSSIKALLATLRHQTFILNLQHAIEQAPVFTCFDGLLLDATTLEIRVAQEVSLNQVFQELSQLDLKIASMRNKTNRLEELFLDLIKNGN